MKKLVIVLFAVVLCLGLNSQAFSDEILIGTLFVNGVEYFDFQAEQNKITIFDGGGEISNFFSFTLHAELNSDPSISYAFTATNSASATLLFTLLLATPIAPVVGPNAVFASLGGDPSDVMVDGSGGGVFVVPFIDSAIQSSFVDDGGEEVSMGVAVHPGAFGPPLASTPFPGFSAGPQPGPVSALGWNTLGVVTNFFLTGGGDSVTMHGFASIDAVPEPSTLLFLGSGLVGLGGLARRRSRKGGSA